MFVASSSRISSYDLIMCIFRLKLEAAVLADPVTEGRHSGVDGGFAHVTDGTSTRGDASKHPLSVLFADSWAAGISLAGTTLSGVETEVGVLDLESPGSPQACALGAGDTGGLYLLQNLSNPGSESTHTTPSSQVALGTYEVRATFLSHGDDLDKVVVQVNLLVQLH